MEFDKPISPTPSANTCGPLRRLWHGAAYYPEQRPDLAVEDELARIVAAGLSVVRLGEFAWSVMEPEQDRIDLGYFVDVLDKIEAAGLKALFCTPTATPPIWLTHGHPERCLHDIEGRPMSHGGRQHLAIDEPFVRERCAIITEAVSRAVGRHPCLIGWQIDNEFKCDVDGDYGPSVFPVWYRWLENRYGTVEQLNEAWGTRVWSQEYQSFDQVPLPVKCPGQHNASLQTAFKRFSRERIADFAGEQIRIVRRHSGLPITHNAGILFQTDPVLVTRDLDFISFDHYVDHGNWHRMVLNYDFWRNAHPSRRFWVMETSSGHNGSLLGFHKVHPTAFVRAEAVAAYALGATGFCYWVWRQQRAGAEMNHGCLMQVWDSPAMGMKAGLEVESARAELEPLLQGKDLCRAEVALLWSDTGRIMLQVEPQNGLHYTDLMTAWAREIRSMGLHLDLVPENASLAGRKVLLTPFVPALPSGFLQRVRRFVEDGGIWIAGPLTGGRTLEHTVPTHRGLGELEEFAGIRTIHSYPLGESGTTGYALDTEIELGGWGYLFESAGARIVGQVDGGPTPGLGFLSECKVGAGKVVVLGAQPVGEAASGFLKTLVGHYAREGSVQDWYNVSAGTLVAPWKSGQERLLVCINMDGMGGSVFLEEDCTDALTGESVAAGVLKLGAYEHRCLLVEMAGSGESVWGIPAAEIRQ